MATPADVDDFIIDTVIGADPPLAATLAANAAGGLPAIDVSPPQGKFLHLLARAVGARRVLEIGTLGGYSTIWPARAVGDQGRVVTLEFEPHHADARTRRPDAGGRRRPGRDQGRCGVGELAWCRGPRGSEPARPSR